MRLKRSRPADEGIPDQRGVLERLSSQITKWGLEAGYFGVEDRLEPRLCAMVNEVSTHLFGDCGGERERLATELARTETEWGCAMQLVTSYRARYGATGDVARAGILRRFRTWVWDCRDYCAAVSRGRRAYALREKLQCRLDEVERRYRCAFEWREETMEALRAAYDFQKARASMARTRKETGHDTREAQNLFVYRAG